MHEETRNDNPGHAEGTASPPSHLFTVRIWPEVSEQGVVNWRGKVQHVPNGAWRYFHDWDALTAFLQSQIEEFATDTFPLADR